MTRKAWFRWQSPEIDLGWQGWTGKNLWLDREGKARCPRAGRVVDVAHGRDDGGVDVRRGGGVRGPGM